MDEAEKPITLMIVDDQPLLRAGIAAMISGYVDIELVGEANCIQDAIELFKGLQPHVMLMTVQTQAFNNIEATQINKTIQAIVAESPKTKIALLGRSDHKAQRMQVISSGAHAYLQINNLHSDLADSVRALAAGRQYRSAHVGINHHTKTSAIRLSNRERQVLHWVAQGRSNREVAQLLAISETTVKGHLHNTMRKLGACNRTHAVALAMRCGIVKVER